MHTHYATLVLVGDLWVTQCVPNKQTFQKVLNQNQQTFQKVLNQNQQTFQKVLNQNQQTFTSETLKILSS
jgi:hypothetical protein